MLKNQGSKRRREEEDDWYIHPEASGSSGPCPPRNLRRATATSVPPTMEWSNVFPQARESCESKAIDTTCDNNVSTPTLRVASNDLHATCCQVVDALLWL